MILNGQQPVILSARKYEKKSSRRQHRESKRDCRTVIQLLVHGIKEVESKNSKQKILSGESDTEGSGLEDGEDQVDNVLYGEFRGMSRSCISDSAVETCSTVDPFVEDTSRKREIDTYSDRNSCTGSEIVELAIHGLIVENRAGDLDREVHQDPNSDRYLIPSEKVSDNAADVLVMIVGSKRSMSLLL